MESVYSAQVAVERMVWVLILAKKGKRNFKCVEVTNKLLTKERGKYAVCGSHCSSFCFKF